MAGRTGATLLPTDLRANLAAPRGAVAGRIRERIDAGLELLSAQAGGPAAFNTFRANRSKWDGHNRELLVRLFKTDELRRIYDRSGAVPSGSATPTIEMEWLRESVSDRIGLLETILDRLGGDDTADDDALSVGAPGEKPMVVVAHVGDIGLARAVAGFLQAGRARPIIVANRPADGEIGVAELDAYREARFAVVLVAGDQTEPGGGSSARTPNPEATLWLGYLAGRLGRARVCALCQPGVTAPGASLGVKSVEYDQAGAWKMLLAQRMKAEGIEIGLI